MSLAEIFAIGDAILNSRDRKAGQVYLDQVAKAGYDPTVLEPLAKGATGINDPTLAMNLQKYGAGIYDEALKRQARGPSKGYLDTLLDPEFQTPEAQRHLAERSSGWLTDRNVDRDTGKETITGDYRKNPYAVDAIEKLADEARNVATVSDYYSGKKDLPPVELSRFLLSGNDADNKLKNLNDIMNTGKDRTIKEAKTKDLSEFQGAIGGLDAPSKIEEPLFAPYSQDPGQKEALYKAWNTPGSTFDVKQIGTVRTPETGRVPTPAEAAADIRNAAADYGVGDSDEVNKAVTASREVIEKTPVGDLVPYQIGVGRSTEKGLIQKMGAGAPKVVAQTTSTQPVNVNVNAPGAGEVDTLAASVVAGQLAPSTISKRGGLQSKVFAKVLQLNPNFSFTEADANAKYKTNSGNLQSLALMEGVTPLLDNLLKKGKALGNYQSPMVNKVRNYVKRDVIGTADITDFDNLRDDVVAEVERIVMGSGVLSDSKYQRAVKNVSSAQNYGQLKAAVNQMKTVIEARQKALVKAPYSGNGGGAEKPAAGPAIAPAGTRAKLPDGRMVTSDGKGGWK